MRTRSLCIGALAVLIVTTCAAVGAQPGESRVIAVGDIHGAHDRFLALLQRVGVVDARSRWNGGRTVFVQTGDYLDRGRDVRAVMNLLIQMEHDAPATGGRVEILLGNHETMNLMMNVRDVTPEIFETFASSASTARLDSAYDDYAAYAKRRSEAIGRPLPGLLTRDAWLESRPVGFVEYVEALGPDGSYGQWIRSQPVAVVIDETVFLHGGLSPENDAASVDEMNDRVANEIANFDRNRAHLIDHDVILPLSTFPEILTAVALELQAWTIRLSPGPPAPNASPLSLTSDERLHLEVLFDMQTLSSWSVIDENGPLWSRSFAQWSDEEGEAIVPNLLDRFRVKRAVVGHTVTTSRRIEPRFDDRVFLIDTGMLNEAYQGLASAVEISESGAAAVYMDGRRPLTDKNP